MGNHILVTIGDKTLKVRVPEAVGAPTNAVLPWPPWAKLVGRFRVPEDRGIGDVIARVIGSDKSEAFKKWYKATFNRDCGCDGRLEQWNTMYPF